MTGSRFDLGVAGAMVVLGVACAPSPVANEATTGRDDAKEAATEQKTAPTPTPSSGTTGTNAGPTEEPEGETGTQEETPPPEAPATEPAGGWPAPAVLEASKPTLDSAGLHAAWTEVARHPGKKLSLQAGVAGGVLVRIDGAAHMLQEDGTMSPLPEADAQSPNALQHAPHIEGFWPKNAWRVSRHELGEKDLIREGLPEEWAELGLPPTRFRFHVFRGNKRWVAQDVGMVGGPDDFTVEESGGVTDPEFDESVVWTVSPRRGLIVAKGQPPREDAPTPLLHFERVGGGEAPESMEYQDGTPVGIYETKGGQMFLFLRGAGEFVVQRGCPDSQDPVECAASSRAKLPSAEFGAGWTVTHAVHRHRKSASFGLSTAPGGGGRSFFLHYETGGFRLEASPESGSIRQMVSSADGAVWAVIGTKLWRRANQGTWARVELPAVLEGAAEIHIAKDGADPARLWLTGGSEVALTTPAVPESAPPAGP